MTFFVHGLNGHEQMPLVKAFKDSSVKKATAIGPWHAIDETSHQSKSNLSEQRHSAHTYEAIEQLAETQPTVQAGQIMSSPVESLGPEANIDMALSMFSEARIRHLPMISSVGLLIGIVSDRDILHHLSGITENFQPQARVFRDERLIYLMKTPVLTSSEDTDIRIIARLFIQQRVGALPVVNGGELRGIVTRSDVVNAVMHHYGIELWA